MSGDPVKLSDLQLTWRNTCVSPVQTWDAPVYHRLLSVVKAVNLSEGRSLRIILADSPIDWSECRTPDDLMPHLLERDNNMAKAVGDAAARGMKVLFLAGGAHIAHLGTGPHTAGMQLKERLPGKVLTVETHCNVAAEHAADVEALLKDWPRPGIGRLADTKLGSRPATWFFPGVQPSSSAEATASAAGANADATLADTVDAYLWLRERAALTRSVVDPAAYLSESYWAELERRNDVIPFPANIEKYRTEADPLFFPAADAS